MKIECSKCGELIETTAKTVVAPFVCSQCAEECDCETCQPTTGPFANYDKSPSAFSLNAKKTLLKTLTNPGVQVELGKTGYEIDYTAVAQAMEAPCDTATVENTTLLIEDLQQQLADERATVIALEAELTQTKEVVNHVNDELVIARQNFIEAHEQINDQAKTIKVLVSRESELNEQTRRLASQANKKGIDAFESHRAFAILLGDHFTLLEKVEKLDDQVALLDSRNGRLQKEISLSKENEDTLVKRLEYISGAARRYLLDYQRECGKVWDLQRHPIRQYFRRAFWLEE